MQDLRDIFDIAGIEVTEPVTAAVESGEINSVALVSADWGADERAALRAAAERMQGNQATASAAKLLLDALDAHKP